MTFFTRKPRARTSPHRDAKPVSVQATSPLSEPANDGIDFDLTGFHAIEDYIRSSLIGQGLLRDSFGSSEGQQ